MNEDNPIDHLAETLEIALEKAREGSDYAHQRLPGKLSRERWQERWTELVLMIEQAHLEILDLQLLAENP